MVRRPADGLLGGLWEFPAVEMGASGVGSSLHDRCLARLEDLGVRLPSQAVRFNLLPEVRHAFTHLKAVYHPMLVVEPAPAIAASPGPSPAEDLVPEARAWVRADQVEDLPIPVAQRKILELARGALAGADGSARAPTC